MIPITTTRGHKFAEISMLIPLARTPYSELASCTWSLLLLVLMFLSLISLLVFIYCYPITQHRNIIIIIIIIIKRKRGSFSPQMGVARQNVLQLCARELNAHKHTQTKWSIVALGTKRMRIIIIRALISVGGMGAKGRGSFARWVFCRSGVMMSTILRARSCRFVTIRLTRVLCLFTYSYKILKQELKTVKVNSEKHTQVYSMYRAV